MAGGQRRSPEFTYLADAQDAHFPEVIFIPQGGNIEVLLPESISGMHHLSGLITAVYSRTALP